MLKQVTIIGAGIIGLASALRLQDAGLQVTIIDRQEPGHGASYGNACSISPYACVPIATPSIVARVPNMLFDKGSPLSIQWHYLWQLAPWLIAFIKAAKPAHVEHISQVLIKLLNKVRDSFSRLNRLANSEDLFRYQGILHIYDSPQAEKRAQYNVDLHQRRGVNLQWLDAKSIHDLEPAIKATYHSGHLYPDGFQVTDPFLLCQKYAKKFQQLGGLIIQDDVKQLQVTPDKIQITTTKQVFHSEKLIIAAGAWSKPLCQQLGDAPLLDTERGYHVTYLSEQPTLNRPIGWMGHGFYAAPMSEQRLRIAGTVELAGLQAAVNPTRLAILNRKAHYLFPHLGKPVSEWLGFRPSMPDSLPVISKASQFDHVFYAFGHGHLGLTLAPVTADILLDLIQQQKTTFNLAHLSVSR